MPSANIERLAPIYEGWGRGDFAVGVDVFEPNAIMVLEPEIPDSGVYVGLEGIRSYTSRFLEAWETLAIVPESFRDVGDTVLVNVTQTGVGEDSGAPGTLNYFHLWTFRGGKVIRLDSILREATALEALGLSE